MTDRPLRVVIAGVPRCGTTLLASLLQQQPGVHFETHYTQWFADALRNLGRGPDGPLVRSERAAILASAKHGWSRLGHGLRVGVDDFECVDGLHAAIAAELAAEPVFGHKLVVGASSIRSLLRGSDVHMILVVRDPRAAALSAWSLWRENLEGYLHRWKQLVGLGAASTHPRLRLVRYEDLVRAPGPTLEQITRWWGATPVVPDELTLSQEKAGQVQPWVHNSAFGDVEDVLSDAPLERWRESRSSPVVRYAWAVAGDLASRLGYVPIPMSTAEKARWRAHETAWLFERRVWYATSRLRDKVRSRLVPPVRHDVS